MGIDNKIIKCYLNFLQNIKKFWR